jgi:hypothetical protein
MSAQYANPRGALEERLRHIGLVAEDHIEVHAERVGEQDFVATVRVTLPSGVAIERQGPTTRGIKPSTAAACQLILDRLHASHPHYFEDWESSRVEAQAGDALIKLAVYLASDPGSAAAASLLLQRVERNALLAELFDRWQAEGDPELADWGNHLSVARKGTVVEALLWRRYGDFVRTDAARGQLGALLALLGEASEPPLP